MPSQTAEPREAEQSQSGGILGRAGITLGGVAVGGVLVIVNEVLAARFLGTRLYGLYALGFVFAKIGELLTLFGLRIGVLRFLPIYRSRGQDDRVLGTMLASISLSAVVGSALVVVVWLLAPWLAYDVFKKPDVLPYLRLFSLAIPFMGLSEILGVITRAYGHAVYYSIIRHFVSPVTYLIGLIVVITLRADPRWIAVACTAAYFMATMTGILCVAKVCGRAIWRLRPAFPFRVLYTYSFLIMVNTFLYLVLGGTDILMLGALTDAGHVGVYRGAMQLVVIFDMIVIAFNAATAHLYAVFAKEKRREELKQAYGTVTRWLGMLAVPTFLIIVLNRRDLLSLLGRNFTVGAGALLILAVGQLIKCCLGSTGFLLVISGRQKLETLDASVGVVLNVVLNLLLIPRYGIVGAAAATTTSHVVMNVLRLMQVRRHFGLATLQYSLFRPLLVAAAVALVVLPAAWLAGVNEGTGLVNMGLRLVVTAGLLAIGMWSLALRGKERADFRLFVGEHMGRKHGKTPS